MVVEGSDQGLHHPFLPLDAVDFPVLSVQVPHIAQGFFSIEVLVALADLYIRITAAVYMFHVLFHVHVYAADFIHVFLEIREINDPIAIHPEVEQVFHGTLCFFRSPFAEGGPDELVLLFLPGELCVRRDGNECHFLIPAVPGGEEQGVGLIAPVLVGADER